MDLIVGAIVILILGGAIFKLIKNKKEGKTSCGCSCSKDSNCSSCNAFK